MTETVSSSFGKDTLQLKRDSLAQAASGSIWARWGDTVLLATVVLKDVPREEIDFFPLLVDYEERLYAAGKIHGSRFIKREGRPSDRAILTARLVDRPIRPLFPRDYRKDVQVIITILSYDGQHQPDILAINAASAALVLSGAPFGGPVGAARVGLVDGELLVNPLEHELDRSELDLVVAATGDKVMMIEASGKQVPEASIIKAIKLGKQAAAAVVAAQSKFAAELPKLTREPVEDGITKQIQKFLGTRLQKSLAERDRTKREQAIAQFEEEVFRNFEGNYAKLDLKSAFGQLVEREIRQAILKHERRPDGRKLDQVRPLELQVGILPRTHGSALFSRGETRVVTIATLGAPGEEQVIETMEEETTKRFMHHYNFPPYSTGEVRPIRSPGRREIGHGVLAERALAAVIPERDHFPYTVRLVSEVVSSNGSTSMAATCGSTLALMDAGVPISSPVAGISIGMVTDGKVSKLLTDIQGVEDFAGDMDFKVAGTTKGITAIQLDIKVDGLTDEIIKQALERAKQARGQILQAMTKVIGKPRPELSPFAPRIFEIQINPEKIGEVIGPGGKTIRKIIEECGGKEVISIDLEDDGTVLVSSADKAAAEKAIAQIEDITREVQVGEVFTAPVTEIIRSRVTGQDVGAVVQILPKTDGMIHISELADHRVAKVSDVVKVGDIVKVKVVAVDKERGRISLSKKQVE